jgi:DNA-binding LytR/AlgR family response regulator
MKAIRNDHTHAHTARIISLYPDRIFSATLQPEWSNRIAFPTAEGIHLIDLRNIAYCSADGNYTHVHLVNGHQLILSRTLGSLDTLLTVPQFIRVHQSYLVQTERIACLQPEQIILDCGTILPVARGRRTAVRSTLINENYSNKTSNPEIL